MMVTAHSGEQKNKLELFLNDVYEKECEFKIEQEEIEFIQTGIETLVQELVDLILKHDTFDKFVSDAINTKFLEHFLYNNKNVVEVNFPIQSDYGENASHIKVAKSTIIKVGSFYDGTKNNFPDEFDFIFPLLSIRAQRSFPGQLYHIHQTVEEAISKFGKFLHYPPMSERYQETRNIYFNKYMDKHGPADKIQFIYCNGSGEQTPIHVDLVPAFRVIDIDTTQWFVEEVRKYVEPKTFREQILSARDCLQMDGNLLAFTEIEQHFMKNIVSKKHVKVYRILKHLLNGNGDGEKLKNVLRFSGGFTCIYTSYRIKILMIYHHESCSNTETEDFGPCVLQVLEGISRYEYIDMFPRFIELSYSHIFFCMFPDLISTIRSLQSMQTSEKGYKYGRDKIKSVSGQCLDRKTRGCCVIL